MAKDGTSVSFAYDEKGLRLSKTVNDVVTRYTYSQGELIHVLDGSDRMTIRRDPNGQPMTIGFNGSEHFFLYNAQGDVVAIANYSGQVVVEYTYDAWGNPLSCTGSLADTLGKKNPFRYRGYVYDEETGLYYLKSRYYDPRVGKFICSDGILPSNRMTSSNLFAYCNNNPIGLVDPSGKIGIIGGLIIGGLIGIVSVLSGCSSVAGTLARDIPRKKYSKNIINSNCYGSSIGISNYNLNPGAIANINIPDDIFMTPKNNAQRRAAETFIYDALSADAQTGIPFNKVYKVNSLDDPHRNGFRRIAVFYGSTLTQQGGTYHVYWEESYGEWWYVNGAESNIYVTDSVGRKIIDPRSADMSNDATIPTGFGGFFDVGWE